jgi:hypothetical protein
MWEICWSESAIGIVNTSLRAGGRRVDCARFGSGYEVIILAR